MSAPRRTRRASGLVMSAAVALFAAAGVAPAQRIVNLGQGEAVREVWASVVAAANRGVVAVDVDESETVLGTVVAPDLVVTKFSELDLGGRGDDAPAALRCTQGDRAFACELVGFDRPSDLALLRAADGGLVPVRWCDEVPPAGAFLASPDGTRRPRGVGVLSAAPYVRTPARAFLGVRFADGGQGVAKLDEVVEHGAARAAGIAAGDVVVGFDGAEISSADELRAQLGTKKPGDRVAIEVRRDDETLQLEVTLGTNNSAPRSTQEHVWGALSEVRSGFQRVLQHDTVLEPADMGGPLVDLDGRVLGVNIARAGRVETLALPAATVREIVARLAPKPAAR